MCPLVPLPAEQWRIHPPAVHTEGAQQRALVPCALAQPTLVRPRGPRRRLAMNWAAPSSHCAPLSGIVESSSEKVNANERCGSKLALEHRHSYKDGEQVELTWRSWVVVGTFSFAVFTNRTAQLTQRRSMWSSRPPVLSLHYPPPRDHALGPLGYPETHPRPKRVVTHDRQPIRCPGQETSLPVAAPGRLRRRRGIRARRVNAGAFRWRNHHRFHALNDRDNAGRAQRGAPLK